jgi:hypothetical protein
MRIPKTTLFTFRRPRTVLVTWPTYFRRMHVNIANAPISTELVFGDIIRNMDRRVLWKWWNQPR